jgi:hypothetical protein
MSLQTEKKVSKKDHQKLAAFVDAVVGELKVEGLKFEKKREKDWVKYLQDIWEV